MSQKKYDVIIIGGGFYGANLALFFKQYFGSVLLIEKEAALLQRASYINQARVHNGYHYPRSFITALRSRINFQHFVADFREAIVDDFQKVYAIARANSKVNAKQFVQFCQTIKADIAPANDSLKGLFSRHLIEAVYTVKEVAFDAKVMETILLEQLKQAGVEIRYQTTVRSVEQRGEQVGILLTTGQELVASQVLNCTYSQINTILQASQLEPLPFKHEITEMALVQLPAALQPYGITIMDGPFFSVMPFPSAGLHSLSHVRYTPHQSWIDTPTSPPRDAYVALQSQPQETNFPMMQKDTQRYIPLLQKATYKKSLFEVKTVLVQNEGDDGRPILFRPDYGLKNFSIVMGGKIDNIYDIITAIQRVKKYTVR